MPNPERFLVRWTNPISGIAFNYFFGDRPEAELFVAARVRKYGAFDGFVKPEIKEQV